LKLFGLASHAVILFIVYLSASEVESIAGNRTDLLRALHLDCHTVYTTLALANPLTV